MLVANVTPAANPNPGRFVISLDFELHWGVRDHHTVESYRANLLGSREVIPKILAMFAAHGIRATWATVGFLFAGSRTELRRHCPETQPEYLRAMLSPYPDLDEIGDNERDDPFHYARSLLLQINAAPGQEIGTHSFSHFYALEPRRSERAFVEDLDAARDIAQTLDIETVSLVFPRNQIPEDYLAACADRGIVAYRGTERVFFQDPSPSVAQRPWRRALRLVDAYLPLGSHHLSRPATAASRPVNVPASRFLRPYTRRLRTLEPLRARRITRAMTVAAKRGETFHLWWHPHNFGANQAENLRFLEQILRHFGRLEAEHGMLSCGMRDVAEQ